MQGPPKSVFSEGRILHKKEKGAPQISPQHALIFSYPHTNQQNRYPTVTAQRVNGMPMRKKSLDLTS